MNFADNGKIRKILCIKSLLFADKYEKYFIFVDGKIEK